MSHFNSIFFLSSNIIYFQLTGKAAKYVEMYGERGSRYMSKLEGHQLRLVSEDCSLMLSEMKERGQETKLAVLQVGVPLFLRQQHQQKLVMEVEDDEEEEMEMEEMSFKQFKYVMHPEGSAALLSEELLPSSVVKLEMSDFVKLLEMGLGEKNSLQEEKEDKEEDEDEEEEEEEEDQEEEMVENENGKIVLSMYKCKSTLSSKGYAAMFRDDAATAASSSFVVVPNMESLLLSTAPSFEVAPPVVVSVVAPPHSSSSFSSSSSSSKGSKRRMSKAERKRLNKLHQSGAPAAAAAAAPTPTLTPTPTPAMPVGLESMSSRVNSRVEAVVAATNCSVPMSVVVWNVKREGGGASAVIVTPVNSLRSYLAALRGLQMVD